MQDNNWIRSAGDAQWCLSEARKLAYVDPVAAQLYINAVLDWYMDYGTAAMDADAEPTQVIAALGVSNTVVARHPAVSYPSNGAWDSTGYKGRVTIYSGASDGIH